MNSLYITNKYYQFEIVPVIDSIDVHDISLNGGRVEIRGSGFSTKETQNVVYINHNGQVPANILESSYNLIICEFINPDLLQLEAWELDPEIIRPGN